MKANNRKNYYRDAESGICILVAIFSQMKRQRTLIAALICACASVLGMSVMPAAGQNPAGQSPEQDP
jgi:hypothetical protein